MNLDFDEIDKINKDKHTTIPYEEFFGEMELSSEEKEKRINLAVKFEILFLFLFLTIQENSEDDIESYKEIVYEKYQEIANEYLSVNTTPSSIRKYADFIADSIVETTIKNSDKQYYLSTDRAMFIAENEANTLGNYQLQLHAIKQGKRYKTWSTMNDMYVRHTHRKVDGTKIGIFDTFTVGDSKMYFPRDLSLGASAYETVNCRCVIKYS